MSTISCVHHDPGTSLAQIDKSFKLKPGSIMEPTFYLGAKLKKTIMPNGVVAREPSVGPRNDKLIPIQDLDFALVCGIGPS
jgi:hypothetical protein